MYMLVNMAILIWPGTSFPTTLILCISLW